MTQPSEQSVRGPEHSVPCPHCGHKNDLRGLRETIKDAFEPGCVVDCDKCGMCAVVTAIVPIVFISLVQDPKGRRREKRKLPPRPPEQRPQRPQQPGLVQRIGQALRQPPPRRR